MKYSIVLFFCIAMAFILEPTDSKVLGLIGSKLKLPAKFAIPSQFNVSNVCAMVSMLPTGLRDTINIGYCSAQCVRQGKRFGYCDPNNACQCVEVVGNATTTTPQGTATTPGSVTTVAVTTAAENGTPGRVIPTTIAPPSP